MEKLTEKPVLYRLVGPGLFAYGIRETEKRGCSIDYAAGGIQEFALMSLLVRTNDLVEVIGCPLGVNKLCADFLDGFFEMRDFTV